MKPTAALLLVLSSSVANADELARLFTDQGKIYLRTNDAASLAPGTELPAFSDPAGKKSVGTAIVMEASGQLVRVTFDDPAKGAAAKFVRVGPSGAVETAPGSSLPPPPPPPPAGMPPRPAELKATLVRGPGYILVRNDSAQELSGCRLDFPDRRWANVRTSVAPGRAVQVPYDDIKPGPDYGDDWLVVRCAEGEAEVFYDKPEKKNPLHARAELRSGSVFLYNDGDSNWTQCDLIKPNGTHFMQGDLRAHGRDTIRGALFKPPSAGETIVLTCAQGVASRAVP